jgi:hypothetical protein
MMSSSRYRIKLYGYTGEAPEAFSKSMSTLVGMDQDTALQLLRNAPSVLQENLEKDRAERIVEALAIMKGLCLAEPMDGGKSAADMAEMALSRIQLGENPPEDEGLFGDRKRVLTFVGFAAVALILILVIPAMFSDTPRTIRRAPPVTRKAIKNKESRRTSVGLEYRGWPKRELKEEYQAIQEENAELAQLGNEASKAISSLSAGGVPAKDPRIRKLDRETVRIRNRLLYNDREMRLIQRRLKALENLRIPE